MILHLYKDFDHGYAATVHKTQGATIDRTFVLGTRHFDKHTAYVAMSRHREDVTMYYSKDEFKDFKDLQRVMGRERPKGLVIDYSLPRGIEPDDRLIQAERSISMRETNRNAQEGLLLKAEEQYVKQMKEKGIQVEFPKGNAVEGYYTRIEEVGGKKYAVIDTHADPSKGVRYMIPYEKQYDQMMRHRFVAYNGHKMSYAKVQSIDKGIIKVKDRE